MKPEGSIPHSQDLSLDILTNKIKDIEETMHIEMYIFSKHYKNNLIIMGQWMK